MQRLVSAAAVLLILAGCSASVRASRVPGGDEALASPRPDPSPEAVTSVRLEKVEA